MLCAKGIQYHRFCCYQRLWLSYERSITIDFFLRASIKETSSKKPSLGKLMFQLLARRQIGLQYFPLRAHIPAKVPTLSAISSKDRGSLFSPPTPSLYLVSSACNDPGPLTWQWIEFISRLFHSPLEPKTITSSLLISSFLQVQLQPQSAVYSQLYPIFIGLLKDSQRPSTSQTFFSRKIPYKLSPMQQKLRSPVFGCRAATVKVQLPSSTFLLTASETSLSMFSQQRRGS